MIPYDASGARLAKTDHQSFAEDVSITSVQPGTCARIDLCWTFRHRCEQGGGVSTFEFCVIDTPKIITEKSMHLSFRIADKAAGFSLREHVGTRDFRKNAPTQPTK